MRLTAIIGALAITGAVHAQSSSSGSVFTPPTVSSLTGGITQGPLDDGYVVRSGESDVPLQSNRVYADAADFWQPSSFGEPFSQAIQIKTLAADFDTTGESTVYSFSVDKPVKVCVLHPDSEAKGTWLSSYVDSGFGTNLPPAVPATWFCKPFASGATVNLAGCVPSGTCDAMYAAAVLPFTTDISIPIAPAASLTAPWLQTDIGTPPTTGDAFNNGSELVIRGSGDLDGVSPSGHFVYQQISLGTAYELTFQANSLTGDDVEYKKLALTILDSLTNPTEWATLSMMPIGATAAWSPDCNGHGYTFEFGTALPEYLRITIDANQVFSAYRGTNSGSATLLDTCQMSFTTPVFIGAWVSSGLASTLAEGKGTDLTLATIGASAGSIQFSATTPTTISEASTPLTITVERAGGANGACSATLSVVGGTAVESTDFTDSLPTSVTFADQDAVAKTFNVTIINRSGVQSPANRTAQVGLSSASGCSLGSPTSHTTTITDDEVVSGTGVKWHPGHYAQMRGQPFTWNSGDQALRFAFYDSISANANIEGVALEFRWARAEGSRGDYSAGFAMIDAEIAKLQSLTVPKRLIIRFYEEFGDVKIFPSYILNGTGGFGGGSCWADNFYSYNFEYWTPQCMDWYIDMIEAYGARYDDNPAVEAIHIIKETSVSLGGHGFNATNMDTQLRRLCLEGKAAWPRTNVIMTANWHIDPHKNRDLIGYCASVDVGWGIPDTAGVIGDHFSSWGDLTVTGAGQQGPWNYGTTDYRGEIPIIQSVEVSEMGEGTVGRNGGYAPADVFDYANNLLHVNHMLWDTFDYAQDDAPPCNSATACKWTTGILPYLNTPHPLTHTDCPDIYADNGGCDTTN